MLPGGVSPHAAGRSSGTVHISPPILTRTLHGKYYFPIVKMKKLKIQDVKPIGQGHRVEKAEHRSEAKAQVLSVIPRAFRWIKNNACVFICFSCTEHLFKSLSLLCASFLLSIKLFVIIKELQFCSPLLRKVRIRVDKVPDAICHQFRVFYK